MRGGGGGGGSRIVYAAVAKSERFIFWVYQKQKRKKRKKKKKRRSGVSRVGLTSPCSPPPATVAAFHCTQFTDWSPVGGGVPKIQPRKKKKKKPNPPTKAACSNRLLPKGCHGNSGGRGTRCPLWGFGGVKWAWCFLKGQTRGWVG